LLNQPKKYGAPVATKSSAKSSAKPATKPATKPSAKAAQAKNTAQDPLHSNASKDIWMAGLGAMAQAQAVAQEKLQEATAHFNQLAQGISTGIHSGIVQPTSVKVDRLEHLFEDRVARALKSLGLPTAQEVAALQERVSALEAALKINAPKAAPRKRATVTKAKPRA
jgi:BMFP domain-containing protein YqiC